MSVLTDCWTKRGQHMGSGEAALDPLFEVLEKTDIPITQFVPTHCSDRGEKLLTQAVEVL